MKTRINGFVVALAILVLCACFTANGRLFPVVQAFTNPSDIPSETTEVSVDVNEFISNVAENETDNTVEASEPETEPVVEVEETPVENTGIEIDISNVKLIYNINEEFNASELVVYAVYSDATKVPLNADEYNISAVDTSAYGTQTVVVEYNGFEAFFEIDVVYTVNEVKPYDRYTTTSLNLRNGPSTQFDIVTTVATNSVVTVIGEVDNGWAKAIYEDQEVFCSAKYLSATKTKSEPSNKPAPNPAPKPVSKGPFTSTSDIFVVEDGVKSEVVDCANRCWATVPTWLQQRFIDSGWKVVLSGTNLSARYGYSVSIAGLTCSGEKTIYLDNRTRAVERAFMHELCHFLDYSYGWPSGTDEFENIFNAEKTRYADLNGVGDGHTTSNVREYFASVVSDMIIYGADKIGDIPETYNYIMNYVG